MIGVVHDDDVAIMQIALELLQHGSHCLRNRTEMLCNRFGLRPHLAIARTQGGREVHYVLDDLRTRYADYGVRHVVCDGVKAALYHGKGDRVDFHVSSSRTMQPILSLCTRASGGTTMVASNSSIISGPC